VVLGIQNMSESAELHLRMAEKGATQALITMANIGNDVSKQYCAGALCNFSRSKECRELLITQGRLGGSVRSFHL
jgi:hypothetical protein